MPKKTKGQYGITPELLGLIKNRRGSKAYLIGTILGIIVGAFFCLAGFIIIILGFNGSIEWMVQAKNFKSKLLNAGPGVLLALAGSIVLWRYKPRVKDNVMVKKDGLIDEIDELPLD